MLIWLIITFILIFLIIVFLLSLDLVNNYLDDFFLKENYTNKSLIDELQPHSSKTLGNYTKETYYIYPINIINQRQVILVNVDKNSEVFLDDERLDDIVYRNNDRFVYVGFIPALKECSSNSNKYQIKIINNRDIKPFVSILSS